jgi:taurine dioxygenase
VAGSKEGWRRRNAVKRTLSIKVEPLAEGLTFGARIRGMTLEALEDDEVRAEIRSIFEDRGLVVFSDLAPSGQMQLAISSVFGPLKDHPVPSVKRVDADLMPGVIDIRYEAEGATLVEVGGKVLWQWLPWHYDHCYNDQLNRAGVLRAIEIAPEGGLTGFADGVQLYEAVSPDLIDRIERCKVLYSLNLAFPDMRFGVPKGFRHLHSSASGRRVTDYAKKVSRAVHPAVWTRSTGEKVLHVSPWMAMGIEGQENPEGDALLEAVCQDMLAKAQTYFHKWEPTDMLVWDNWRLIHCATGLEPGLSRRMHRTTIAGDYGLGYFEKGGAGDDILEMVV